jgi:hypothetical protein
MEGLHPVLRYLTFTSISTLSGLFYWFAAENLREHKHRFVLALGFSLVISPLGAWFVSVLLRAGHLLGNNTAKNAQK